LFLINALLRMNPSQFSPSGKNVRGAVLSLLADLTQGGIVPLKTGDSQQLFCTPHRQWQNDMNRPE
jgi:hypothetical protein